MTRSKLAQFPMTFFSGSLFNYHQGMSDRRSFDRRSRSFFRDRDRDRRSPFDQKIAGRFPMTFFSGSLFNYQVKRCPLFYACRKWLLGQTTILQWRLCSILTYLFTWSLGAYKLRSLEAWGPGSLGAQGTGKLDAWEPGCEAVGASNKFTMFHFSIYV